MVARRGVVTQLVNPEKALKIIARSLFRDLLKHGYKPRQVVALTVELLDLTAAAMRGRALGDPDGR
jgi:hypothetical protein